MIHIVEPTLEDDAGHCHNFLSSLCRVDPKQPFTAWIGADAGSRVLADLPNVTIRRHFHRRLRRLQELLLFRRLFAEAGRILVSTASTVDLALVHWAGGSRVAAGRIYMYFHWFRERRRKQAQFRWLTRRLPGVVGLCPTASVESAIREGGFQQVRRVAYPIRVRELSSLPRCAEFRSVLFAGQARRDKGFDRVVDLVAHLASVGSDLPIRVQIGPEHYGKVQSEIQSDLDRLRRSQYPHLRLKEQTLTDAEYLALYPGSIALQLYRQQDFADRISGVTLDSVMLGAPILTVAGTWMANVVSRFRAGQIVADSNPGTILEAIQAIRNDYGAFHSNALKAGAVLREEHDPRRLLERIRA
jgi:hypothetical protein